MKTMRSLHPFAPSALAPPKKINTSKLSSLNQIAWNEFASSVRCVSHRKVMILSNLKNLWEKYWESEEIGVDNRFTANALSKVCLSISPINVSIYMGRYGWQRSPILFSSQFMYLGETSNPNVKIQMTRTLNCVRYSIRRNGFRLQIYARLVNYHRECFVFSR